MSLQEARRRKEVALARLRELEVGLKEGRVLDAAVVEQTWADMMRRLQASVLALGPRLRQQLPHLSAHDVQVLDRELRVLLSGMAAKDETSAGGAGQPHAA